MRFLEVIHLFRSVGCVRNKLHFHTVQQNLKSFPSMQVLRMDEIPALDLLDLVIEVFHSSLNQTNKTKDVREPRTNLSATLQSTMRIPSPTTNTNPDLTNIDHVPSSGTHSGSNAMLYVSEDNEAVIKMIIKGRSPTMGHVSRTHRVCSELVI